MEPDGSNACRGVSGRQGDDEATPKPRRIPAFPFSTRRVNPDSASSTPSLEDGEERFLGSRRSHCFIRFFLPSVLEELRFLDMSPP